MERPENHKRQIADARKASLAKAGVPAGLIEKALGDIDCGAAIGEWLGSGGAASIIAGNSWFIETETVDAESVLPLIARALHLRGTGCRVVRLSALVRAVENRDYDQLDALCQPDALFVLRFFERSKHPLERPFSAYQRMQIEDLLLDRVASRKANILQIVKPLESKSLATEWWTPSMLEGLRAETFKAAK